MHDGACLVDHKAGAVADVMVAGHLGEFDVEAPDGDPIEVAEEGIGQLTLVGPEPGREMAIDADAVDFRSRPMKLIDLVLKGGQLVASATGEGEVIEGEHNDPLLYRLTQGNPLALGAGKGEVRGLLANINRHASVPSFRVPACCRPPGVCPLGLDLRSANATHCSRRR